MPKLIAFYGSPGGGKTSVALKAAMETYIQTKDEVVAFLSPDTIVPSIALLFPNYSPDEVVSLSEIFDNTAITSESLLKNAVTVKSMKDFFALGFKAGENRFSFPTPTPEKINSLFSALSDVAGYIFFDCTNDETDEISKKAISKNELVNGKFVVEGYFEQPEIISETLQRKLLQFGVSQNELVRFLEKGADYGDI